MPPLATIKLWIYAGAVAAFGILFTMLKVKSTRLEVAQERVKAKSKQVENGLEAIKLQEETIALSKEAHELREKIARMSNDDVNDGLREYMRD